MSEEEAEKPSGGGSGDGGSVLRKWGPLAAIVLVAQGIVAFWVVTTFNSRVGSQEHASEPLLSETQVSEGGAKAEHTGPLPEYYSPKLLQKILANPAGTNASQVVMVSVELGLTNINEKTPVEEKKASSGEGEAKEDKDMAKLTPYLGKMRSIIVDLISSKGVDEILDPEGKKALQEEIKKALNSQIMERVYLPDKEDEEAKLFTITEVIFPEFVIQ